MCGHGWLADAPDSNSIRAHDHRLRPHSRSRPAGLGRRHRPGAHRVHPHPGQVAHVRHEVGGARPYRPGGDPDDRLGPEAEDRGPDHRGRPARGPHAGHPHGSAGRGRRDRAALRPLRQAAGDGGLGRGRRAVDAGAPRRSALRPRGGGRRLRVVRGAHRDRDAAGPGNSARALRGADRGLRGERQPRPAGLRGEAGRSHPARPRRLPRLRAAATTTTCGPPPRCAAS